VRRTTRGEGPLDLAVSAGSDVREAVATQAEALILEGRVPKRALRLAGLSTERFLPLPDRHAPEVILPLDQPLPARYAISEWTVARRPWKIARNRILTALIGRALVPPLPMAITVAAPGPPFAVAEAERRLEAERLGWFLTLGEGDALARGVFHLFPPSASEPSWVLKFSRVGAHVEPFDREEKSLSAVAAAGGELARHAPRLLERFEVDGLPASLETAAAGRRLTAVLNSPRRSERDRARPLVDEVAAWLVAVARSTATGPDRLDQERRRVADEVVPRWRELGATRELVTALPPVPAVFEHRDLGSWNLIAGRGGFTAVDWESSCPTGFPLWDLLYFMTDALAHLDGASSLAARPEHARRLYRGESASSDVLFRWIARMVEATSLPREAVGPLATLCWMHHGVSHLARGETADALAAGDAAFATPFEGIARAWLTDPALGPRWDRWRS
jgi:hypothetical protein